MNSRLVNWLPWSVLNTSDCLWCQGRRHRVTRWWWRDFGRLEIGSKIHLVGDRFESVQRVSHSGLWQPRYFLPLPQGQGLLLPRFNFLYRFSSEMYCCAAASNPPL